MVVISVGAPTTRSFGVGLELPLPDLNAAKMPGMAEINVRDSVTIEKGVEDHHPNLMDLMKADMEIEKSEIGDIGKLGGGLKNSEIKKSEMADIGKLGGGLEDSVVNVGTGTGCQLNGSMVHNGGRLEDSEVNVGTRTGCQLNGSMVHNGGGLEDSEVNMGTGTGCLQESQASVLCL